MASPHPYLGDLDYDSDEDDTPRSGHMRDYEKISKIGRGGFGLVSSHFLEHFLAGLSHL